MKDWLRAIFLGVDLEPEPAPEPEPDQPEGWDGRLAQAVVVHTRDKQSVAGVLVGVYPKVIQLAGARLLSETHGAPIPLDGDTIIERANIAFVQAGVAIDDTRHLRALASGREVA